MKKTLLLVLCVITLILELLPFGAVLRFATPDAVGDIAYNVLEHESFYSYFDPITYGYANFGPFITAILTVVLFAALIVYCLKNKGLMIAQAVSGIAVFTSLLPLIMYGVPYVTVIGVCITALLTAMFAVSFIKDANKNK